MRFRDTRLYKLLKTGSYTIDKILEYTPTPVKGVAGDLYDTTKSVAKNTADVSKQIRGPLEDAGYRLGSIVGDMFGKLSTDNSKYEHDYGDILKLINDKEEIALLRREAERLRRLARIEQRKRESIREMTTKALKSPFI